MINLFLLSHPKHYINCKKVSLFLSLMFTGVDAPKSSPFVFLCACKRTKPKQAGTAILGKGDVSDADLIYWSLTNNSLL